MNAQPNGDQVTGSRERFGLNAPSAEGHPPMLMPEHWRGLMSVAVVLGMAWINLSRLPTHAVVAPQWIYLLRMLLLFILVPLVTTGIHLLYHNHLPSERTSLWSATPSLGLARGNSWDQRERPSLWNRIADNVSICTVFVLILLDVVNFVAGRGYGTTTTVPWAVNVEGVMRHPVQLYSAFALGVLLVLLWRMRSRLFPGETLWHFVMFYSLIQLIISDFCASAVTWGAGVRMEQFLALVTLLGSMYVLSQYAQRRADAFTGVLWQEARG